MWHADVLRVDGKGVHTVSSSGIIQVNGKNSADLRRKSGWLLDEGAGWWAMGGEWKVVVRGASRALFINVAGRCAEAGDDGRTGCAGARVLTRFPADVEHNFCHFPVI